MYQWMRGSNKTLSESRELDTKDNLQNFTSETANLPEKFSEIKEQYPGWIPVIIHPKNLIINKDKYVTQKQVTLKQFALVVRQFMDDAELLDERHPLFFVANDVLLKPDCSLEAIYNDHKEPDGFLHLTIHKEH
jgi:hypothetical protein